MRHGYIKVAAASVPVRVADCAYNAAQTVAAIREAAARNIRILVLPELGLTGYTCGDLLLQKTLLDGALDALETVRAATAGMETLTFVGLPLAAENKLYNCAAALFDGEILGVVPTALVRPRPQGRGRQPDRAVKPHAAVWREPALPLRQPPRADGGL